MQDDSDRVRLDKWLWAARFYKTRSLATDAVSGGKVEVNGERAKPAKAVKADEHVLVVRQLGERRGPAAAAQALYEETQASQESRARLAAQLKMAPPTFVYEEKGRPTKKDRRDLSRLIDRKRR
jgi:ribosome-associated heat shock protein Hsp15